MFGATVPATTVMIGHQIFGKVISRVGKIADFGHMKGKGFGKRAVHPHPVFLGVPLNPGHTPPIKGI